jgi:Arc/MetJ family transcription regulator
MKTTVDIPDSVLREAMENTGATTKREAVLAALNELNRRHRVEKVIAMMGTSDTFMSHDELMAMREADLDEKHRLYSHAGHVNVGRGATPKRRRKRKAA